MRKNLTLLLTLLRVKKLRQKKGKSLALAGAPLLLHMGGKCLKSPCRLVGCRGRNAEMQTEISLK